MRRPQRALVERSLSASASVCPSAPCVILTFLDGREVCEGETEESEREKDAEEEREG